MRSEKPLITTIIPTYRRPKLLRRAIKSVLNQTYKNFQICIYDNASGDETANIVAEFASKDPRVIYFCHKENIGALNNFNFGLQRVNTPYFSFLSDDDILLPEFYETALEGFNKFSDAMLSAGATIHMNDKGDVLNIPLFLWQRDGLFLPPYGFFEMIGKHPEWTAILFRREVIEHVGILDEKVGAPADLDFELRIASRFPIVISRKPCAVFMYHNDSFCSNIRLEHYWPNCLKMIKNITENSELPEHTKHEAERMLTKYIINILYFLAKSAIAEKRFEEANKIAQIFDKEFSMKMTASLISNTSYLCNKIPLLLSSIKNFFKYKRLILREINLFTRGKYNMLSEEYIQKIVLPLLKYDK